MRASLAIGLLVLVASAAAADEPARAAEAQPPVVLAAGDALGLSIWDELDAAKHEAPAPVREPAPPAAMLEE